MAQPAAPQSSRIEALRRALESGDTAALEAFWREIETAGAPLVEPAPDGDAHLLVTFVWRGSAETRNVVVVRGPAGYDFARNQLAHLGDTSLWYKTYRARRDLRTIYWLSENDSLVPMAEVEESAYQARTAGWLPDPLNPRRYVMERDEEIPGDRDFIASPLELPGAPPQPHATPRDGVPHGKVAMVRLPSAILGNERRVWIYTPPGYITDGDPYALALLFDGLAAIRVLDAPATLDNLLHEGKLPPLVLVCPDSLNNETRLRELLYHQPFVDYLTRELLPWVRARYHITGDPQRALVGGLSAGGVAAVYAAWRAPGVFGKVLSQSGAFWTAPEGDAEGEWLARQLAVSDPIPARFYLDAGLMEVHSSGATGVSLLVSNRHLRDVLRAKGCAVTYAEFNGGHDYLVWRGTLADGLLALLGIEVDDPGVS